MLTSRAQAAGHSHAAGAGYGESADYTASERGGAHGAGVERRSGPRQDGRCVGAVGDSGGLGMFFFNASQQIFIGHRAYWDYVV